MGSRCNSPAWNDIPANELAEFDRILGQELRTVTHLKWFHEGFSGSPVALVRDKLEGRPDTEEIIKFCGRGEDEAQAINRAYEAAPAAFRQTHMVKPGRVLSLDKWSAVLMEIVGGDLSAYEPVAGYAAKRELKLICDTIVTSLLRDWNSGLNDRNRDLSVGAFLRQVMGEQKATRESKLGEFADQAGINWESEWIVRPGWGYLLVNPLFLLSHEQAPILNAIVGFGHGDLSVHNVFVHVNPELDANDFWLIDYGTFSYPYPLTRDPMYLLVSLATQWLQRIRLPSDGSSDLIKEFANRRVDVDRIGYSDYRQVIDATFAAGRQWATNQKLGRHWMPQSLLSLAGSALTFIGREIPGLEPRAMNDWLFNLAAVVLTEYTREYRSIVDIAQPPTDYKGRGAILANEHGAQASASVERMAAAEQVTPDANPLTQEQYNADSPISSADEALPSPHSDAPEAIPPERLEVIPPEVPEAIPPEFGTYEHEAMEGLLGRVGSVGAPPVQPLRRSAIGTWLVTMGDWVSNVSSLVYDVEGVAYLIQHSPSARFIQAVDDSRAGIQEMLKSLTRDPFTRHDADLLASKANVLWRHVEQLVRLSVES